MLHLKWKSSSLSSVWAPRHINLMATTSEFMGQDAGYEARGWSSRDTVVVHEDPLRADAKDHKSWNRSSNRDQTKIVKNQGKSLTYEDLM
jgi:hypothetical protein